MIGNRIIVVGPRRVDHHHSTTVTEKRAPTDESVRLLRQMEDRARADVLDAIKVGDTHFECVVHAMRDVASGDMLLKAIFSLNGKKLTADTRTPNWQCSPAAVYENLVDIVAGKIAADIIRPAMDRLLAEDRWFR